MKSSLPAFSSHVCQGEMLIDLIRGEIDKRGLQVWLQEDLAEWDCLGVATRVKHDFGSATLQGGSELVCALAR